MAIESTVDATTLRRVRVPFVGRVGALHERDFRLLFAGTTITTVGDRLAGIALAFAVLDIASATALGIVFAVRQGVQALVVVAGGVLSDRIPRNLVLVGASLVQGVAQALPRGASGSQSFLHELREGWQEFTSRTWLWASVVLFGIGNVAFAGWIVLGPAIADERLGGAGPWAAILTASGLGAVLGGIIAIRIRPRRPLVVCVLSAALLSLQTLALALSAPTAVIAAAAFVGGMGLAVHLTLWFTVFQQQVPEQAQSRVASYDTLGSFVLVPLGMALVGPLADAIGIVETLWLALLVMWSSWALILALPSVWAIRRPARVAVPSPA